MEAICLDLEGVLIPEIWIAVACKTQLDELKLTTRDIDNYDDLMNHRLNILHREGILLDDILEVINGLDPLDGALEFTAELRSETQLIILSDTFVQFAAPLMKKLDRPSLFCNTLEIDKNGRIIGYKLRQHDGKRRAVEAFRSMGLRVFAAGDSYNDVSMLQSAHTGMFFRAPKSIREQYPQFHGTDSYGELLAGIREFCLSKPETE